MDNVESVLPDYRRHKFIHRSVSIPNEFHEESCDRPYLLVFSAHNEATLKCNLNAYSDVGSKADLLDLAYTLATRRTKHSSRTFAICRKRSFSADFAKASESTIEPAEVATVAFAFTGQGAQWPRMGAKLFQLYPSFLRTIRELDNCLSRLPDAPTWTLEASLQEAPASNRVNEAEFSQPLCTAVQVALVNLFSLWGVVPVATVGHSSGEIAAAYASGQISAGDAIIAAYYRGKVSGALKTKGAMLAVGIGAPEAAPFIEKYKGRVVVACHNSPSSATFSGDAELIGELKSALEDANIFARVLKTDGKAYHSHHMKEAAQAYERHLRTTDWIKSPGLYNHCKSTMISSVTGLPVEERIIDHAYWTKNLVSPVLFSQAVQRMISDNPSVNLIVEIGPHSALSGPIRQICTDLTLSKVSYLPTLVRNEHDGDQLLKLAGNLWARDAPVDIGFVTKVEESSPDRGITERQGSLLVDLPPYQWSYYKQLWLESRASREHRSQKHPRHDVLGRRVLGLSDVETVWRNVLRHKDLPWLRHHSLGGESVFPAAGYFAMAIEAITQLNSDSPLPREITSYTLRNIVISSAIVIPDNDEGVETLLSLRSSNIKSTTAEGLGFKQWYHYTVSSFSFGEWKENGKGSIGINIRSRGRKPISPPEFPFHTTYKSWNTRLRDLGFDFGPTFQYMTDIQHDGKTHGATANMAVKQECGMVIGESRYALHPACIDGCLQLFIVSIYAGRLGDVACGTVLTHFDEVTIWPPAPHQMGKSDARLYSWTPKRGNRAFVSSAQLVANNGELLADFMNVRCLSYEAALPQQLQSGLRQDPYMQLEWKADTDYLEYPKDVDISSTPSVACIVDLLVHKNASLSILCLDIKLVPEILKLNSSLNITVVADSGMAMQNLRNEFGQHRTIKFSQLDVAAAELAQEGTIQATYDLIVTADQAHRERQVLQNMNLLLVPGGRLLLVEATREEGAWRDSLKLAGFSEVDQIFHDSRARSFNILSKVTVKDMATSTDTAQAYNNINYNILLVYRETHTPFISFLIEQWTKKDWTVRSSPLNNIDYQAREQVIMLADLEAPILATLREDELKSLQYLIENTSSMIWATPGGLLAGQKPEYGMTSGFARVLKNEKQNLDLVTLDFDPDTTSDMKLMKLLEDIVSRQARQGRDGETEYCIDRGVVHIGRLTPNKAVNEKFATSQGHTKLVSLKEDPTIQGILHSGKIAFQEAERAAIALESLDVEIKIMAAGLNSEDSSAVYGSDDANAFTHEIAGYIASIGSDVSHLKVGDRAVGFAFNMLATYQRIPAKLVRCFSEDIPFLTMASLPMAFATALYGLDNLARIEEGEVALIIDGSGPAGLAAIQVCELSKASAIVVTSSKGTVDSLHRSGFPLDRILMPGQEDLVVQIRRATAGHGVDIVFCHNSVDQLLMHECFLSMAPLGRLVTYGGKNRSLDSLSGISISSRASSVFSFDITDLYLQKPKVLAKLLETTMQLYSEGKISTFEPVTIKGLPEINETIGSFSNELGAGKFIISYEVDSTLKVLPIRPRLQFRPDVTYLLAGCLGGLGRSLASWMIERGAKRLAFMSRSGTDNPQAAAFVDSIRALGVHAQVLQADVTSKTQVQGAVKEIDPGFPIRGVVNAVVVLQVNTPLLSLDTLGSSANSNVLSQDGMFHNMNIDGWSRVVNPKLRGSVNLHEALQDQQLDFFVMTSSITATLGSTGQSNYGAANAFLDAFAHHRRMCGLPAVSLILPMVLGIGYIADNPEIEASIRHKGMYGVDANEMLAAFEVAMTPQTASRVGFDHLIVGIETSQLAKSVAATDADTFWLDEARLRTVRAAIELHTGKKGPGSGDTIITVVQSAKSPEDAVEAVTKYLVQRLSRLLMINVEDFQPERRSIVSYGLDSMIGAEFRNWVFKEFKVDVPFQQLLAGNLTVAKFATNLCIKLGKIVE